MKHTRFFVYGTAVLSGVMRFVAHPPNMTSFLACALLTGAYGKRRDWLIPLLIFFVGDLWFGIHPLVPVVYGTLAIAVALGRSFLRGGCQARASWLFGRTFLIACVSSGIFFVITNSAVWLFSGMYPVTSVGLIRCFVLAVPFWHRALASDIFFSILFFGIMFLVERRGRRNYFSSIAKDPVA
ncbi:MAG: hypothetical protein JW725_01125 [Candidatus Babeliaceae bacterium]|nr:hypothetical protein [Candidatus Babeliaceae bacterium]